MLLKKSDCPSHVWLSLACCYFFLGMYPEADEAAQKGQIVIFGLYINYT